MWAPRETPMLNGFERGLTEWVGWGYPLGLPYGAMGRWSGEGNGRFSPLTNRQNPSSFNEFARRTQCWK
ncbi:MAG: hypothetical protein JWM27_2173 [Gemmatimonadetes bacterium]|nr:hypothetical protein [Gemmatimonadota bacterium]